MEIKLIHGSNYDDAASLVIKVNGKSVVRAFPLYECPEDATLERDLDYVYDIPMLMEKAYEAGKNGEEFVVIEENESEDD
jgi:hypothetical protein